MSEPWWICWNCGARHTGSGMGNCSTCRARSRRWDWSDEQTPKFPWRFKVWLAEEPR